VSQSQDDRTILSSPMSPQPFENFGKYILLKRLAAGGMAEVFLARPATSDGNGRVLVVKRILPHVADQAMFVEMFRSEIQVIMGFNHPHTVQLHDFGECAKRPFIAMEFIEGKSLKEILTKFIQQRERMPIPMALGLIAQAASGLNYAHSFVNKVTDEVVHAIHRDISPHNLMVTYEGNLKVIDFGIAKAATRMREATQSGTIKGKMAYLSPEQISGQNVDARTDVFALGVVAWELLTMRRAFICEGDSEITVLSRIDNCENHLVPPSNWNPSIPKDVDELILKALKKNPKDRYQSAKDFQSALRRAMQTHFPDYSYADTAQTLNSLFMGEMQAERKELQDLNVLAQMSLIQKTVPIPHFVPDSVMPKAISPRAAASLPSNSVRGGAAADPVSDRLTKIERLMRQNASTRHYVWLAFYVLAIVVLQLEGKYSIFNYLIPIPEVGVSQAAVLPPTTRAPLARSHAKTPLAAPVVAQKASPPVVPVAQAPLRPMVIQRPAKIPVVTALGHVAGGMKPAVKTPAKVSRRTASVQSSPSSRALRTKPKK